MVRAGITEPLVAVLSRPAVRGTLLGTAVALGIATLTPPLATGVSASAVGRIEGVVRVVASGDAPIASGAYPTRRVSRPAPRVSEIANVIVFIKDPPSHTAAIAPMRARMVQVDETFSPRVVAITCGSSVEFPNSDPYFHNVFSLSRGANFDLGRYPRGQSRVRLFPQPGLVKVFCHLHSHMSASIMVFDHPYFAVPGGDGAFSLHDVPTGEYQISAWHERIGESPKTIRVEPGAAVRVEFSLPVEVQ
jgi:plastocyanin